MQDARAVIATRNAVSAVVFIEVQKPDGVYGIASGFHIGNGLIATARHVIDENRVVSIGRGDTSISTEVRAGAPILRTRTHSAFRHSEFGQTHYHPDDRVDLAIIQMEGNMAGYGRATKLEPYIQLAPHTHLLSSSEFLMAPVIVLGYPPIPVATGPELVAFNAEISATIQSRHDGMRHFVISGTARGGFSGGPILLLGTSPARIGNPVDQQNIGAVAGIVGTSLIEVTDSSQPAAEQLGYLAALSSGAIYDAVAHNRLSLPRF